MGGKPKLGKVDDSKDGESQGTPTPTTAGAVAMTTIKGVSKDPEEVGEIFALSTYLEGRSMLGNDNDLKAMKATSDPDTLFYHEAMKEPDAAKFEEAMGHEWEDQMGNGNFLMMLKSEVPPGAKVLPSMWQMKRKRDVSTG